ncbi:MAG: lysylphosphatidylglycerol synthase domain-containing protein [Halothiobacillaceae bacterium]
MTRVFRLFVPYLLVVLLALGVEWALGWRRLLAPWAEVPLSGLGVAVALMLGSHVLRAWRVADHFDIHGHFGAVLSLNLQHNLWNNLLPMRVGELSFPILMRQRFGCDPAHALAGLFWIRLVDAQVLAALGLGGLLWLAKVQVMALAWLGLALLAPLAVWALRGGLQAWVVGLEEGRLRSLLDRILAGLPRDVAHLSRGVLLTWANWLIKLTALAWVLRQFLAIDWIGAGLAVFGGEVTSVLPMHAPGGFGTYEAGMLGVLLPQGMEPTAATAAAINTHLFLLVSSLFFGLTAMLIVGKSATMPTPAKDSSMP